MSLLETRQLRIAMGSKAICSRLDFALHQGQHWGVLGGNGVGKTTLLNALAGLHPKLNGSIRVDEREIDSWQRKELARVLGLLFQDSVDTFPSTVMETAMSGRYPHLSLFSMEGKSEQAMVEQALKNVALNTMASRQVDTLSGGERRRLALAILLVQNPRIWLLDEPTNHLDLHHQIALLELINNRVNMNGGGLIMVLHDVNLVSRFCTHAMLMINHEEILCGPVDEVINEENLAVLYQHAVKRVRSEEGDFFYPQ